MECASCQPNRVANTLRRCILLSQVLTLTRLSETWARCLAGEPTLLLPSPRLRQTLARPYPKTSSFSHLINRRVLPVLLSFHRRKGHPTLLVSLLKQSNNQGQEQVSMGFKFVDFILLVPYRPCMIVYLGTCQSTNSNASDRLTLSQHSGGFAGAVSSPLWNVQRFGKEIRFGCTANLVSSETLQLPGGATMWQNFWSGSKHASFHPALSKVFYRGVWLRSGGNHTNHMSLRVLSQE